LADDIGIKLSFSARDLITRMVRENGSVLGMISNLEEPMLFRRPGTGDEHLQLSDVQELVLNGLIIFWKHAGLNHEELYRPSEAGKKTAGAKAIADAQRSARPY
jgi:hypothetical protein